jgi:hypothetical protein
VSVRWSAWVIKTVAGLRNEPPYCQPSCWWSSYDEFGHPVCGEACEEQADIYGVRLAAVENPVTDHGGRE